MKIVYEITWSQIWKILTEIVYKYNVQDEHLSRSTACLPLLEKNLNEMFWMNGI